MPHHHYETESITAYFDPDSQYIRIDLQGHVSAVDIAENYQWLDRVFAELSPESVHGAIINTIAVEHFDPRMLHVASRESLRFNKAVNLDHVPIALVVKNMYQERIMNLTTKLHVDKPRRKTVFSIEEAIQFIEDWRNQNLNVNK